jgi:hypothetical protein
MSVCCACRVLSGRVFSIGLITRPEASYRASCEREASIRIRPWPTVGCCAVQVLHLYDSSGVLSYNVWFFETLALLIFRKQGSHYVCVGGWVGLLTSLDDLEEQRFSSPSLESNHYSSVFNRMI